MKMKLTAVLAVSLLMVGCNTWRGFGEDVQKAGEKIEKSASTSKSSSTTKPTPAPAPTPAK